MKKLLGWHMGIILALIWGALELLSVYTSSQMLGADGGSVGFLSPMIAISNGHVQVDWVSGIFGFAVVSVYSITRWTWQTASEGYLFTDLVGSTGVATTVYTAVIVGNAQIYPEMKLNWQANFLGGISVVILFWLATETILLLLSAIVLAGHGQRLKRVSAKITVRPVILLVALFILQGFLTYQQLTIKFSGGVYSFLSLGSPLIVSAWLIGLALVLMLLLVAILTRQVAQVMAVK